MPKMIAGKEPPTLAALLEVCRMPGGWGAKAADLRAMLRGLPVAELEKIAKITIADPKARAQGYQLLAAIGEHWAEQDPEGLVQFAQTSVKQRWHKSSLMTMAVREIALTDRGRALALASSVADQRQSSAMIRSVAGVALQDSPEWAVDLIAENGRGWGHWEMNDLYSKWALQDLPTARAYLDKLPDGHAKRGAIEAVASSWVAESPEAAIAWARSLASEDESDSRAALSSVVKSLVIDDPERGLALIEEMGASNSRDQLMGEFARSWFGADPEQARAWYSTLDDQKKKQVLSGAAYEISSQDPKLVLDLVKSLPGHFQDSYIVSRAINNMKQADLADARQWVESMPEGEGRRRGLQAVLARWATFKPDEAASYAADLPDGNENKNIIGSVASMWAQSDGQAAVEWASKLPLEDRKNLALSNALGSWAQSSPREAAEFLGKMPAGSVTNELVTSVSRRWASSDPDKTLDWAADLPPSQRGAATRAVIKTLADSDPSAAAERFAEFGEALQTGIEGAAPGLVEKQVADVASTIASEWAGYEPHEAAAWALGLDDGKPQASAVSSVVGSWVQRNPLEVSEWLVELPQGETRDRATQSLVRGITESDTESAYSWAISVGDMKIRETLVSQVARRFAQTDYDRALGAIQESGLPAAAQAEILKELE